MATEKPKVQERNIQAEIDELVARIERAREDGE